MANELVGQIGRIVDRRDRGHHLGRNLLVEPDVVIEGRVDRTHQSRDLGGALANFLDLLDLDLEVIVDGRVAHDPRALLALEQRLDGAVREPQELHDHAQRADRVNVVGPRVRNPRVLLGREEDRPFILLGGLQRLNRLLPSDQDRIDLVGENNQFAQRQQRNSLSG
jgi:hypothetical protein